MGIYSCLGPKLHDRFREAAAGALVATLVVSTTALAQTGFTDVTERLGLAFSHQAGEESRYLLPEITGAGAAFLDFDGDGDLDIYLVQGGRPAEPRGPVAGAEPNRLFRQEEDGSFADVTEESGLGDRGYGMGVAVGDVDNDGLVDVFVTNYGPDVLYRNEGGGRFRDVTGKAGITGEAWSASAAFCDYDADGFLDLYVTRYVTNDPQKRCTHGDGSADYCSPQVFPGTTDSLYRNDRDGTFTDVSRAAGLTQARAPGLGVLCADFDSDGKLDFYVANDGAANQLWINQGDGRFLDEAFLTGTALNDMGQPEAGMGLAVGDVDGDGDLDLFMTHIINETNTLYLNEGALGFVDGSTGAGLGASSLARTGFGTAFLDYDHDGDLDLAIANGRVQRHPPLPGARLSDYWNSYAEPNQLMENRGQGKFEDASDQAGDFSRPIEISRGLATGDFDEDGDLDLLVMNTGSRARLYRNDVPKKGAWLRLRAYDPGLKRDAHGALVTLVTSGGRMTRIANPGFSFLSSNDGRAHFGVPEGRSVEAVEVIWPDGAKETFGPVALNQTVVLEKGRGE